MLNFARSAFTWIAHLNSRVTSQNYDPMSSDVISNRHRIDLISSRVGMGLNLALNLVKVEPNHN